MVFSTVLTGIIYCLLAFEVLATLLLSLPLGAGNAIVKLFASSTLTAKLKVPFGVVVLSIALVLLGTHCPTGSGADWSAGHPRGAPPFGGERPRLQMPYANSQATRAKPTTTRNNSRPIEST
jgi:hypothetical protein